MNYCCDDCGFLFRRIGEVRACPFCEGSRFRSATPRETEILHDRLKEIYANDLANRARVDLKEKTKLAPIR